MKVRLKQRTKRYQTLSCRCCDRVMLKEHMLDKQTLKEAVEEVNVEFGVVDSTPGCDPV